MSRETDFNDWFDDYSDHRYGHHVWTMVSQQGERCEWRCDECGASKTTFDGRG